MINIKIFRASYAPALKKATMISVAFGVAISILFIKNNKCATVYYKVTLVVSDGHENRYGSAIWKVRINRSIFNIDQKYHFSFYGEAVAVNLGKHNYIFMLPVGYNGSIIDPSVLPERLFSDRLGLDMSNRVKSIKSISNHKNIIADLPCMRRNIEHSVLKLNQNGLCFRLAYSSNPDDYKLLRAIPSNDMANIFGGANYISTASVQIVDGPESHNIENILPWSKNIKNNYTPSEKVKSPYSNDQINVKVVYGG